MSSPNPPLPRPIMTPYSHTYSTYEKDNTIICTNLAHTTTWHITPFHICPGFEAYARGWGEVEWYCLVSYGGQSDKLRTKLPRRNLLTNNPPPSLPPSLL